jgi:carboxylate-amine ligase
VAEFSVGVEEEFHLLEAESGQLYPRAADVLTAADGELAGEVEPELLRTQVETGTPVCATLDDVRAQLSRQRRELAATAAAVGCRIAASGTWPAPVAPVAPTPEKRYEELAAAVGPVAHRPVCGCHVHVQVGDPDMRVAVIRRVRSWLPSLLAVSANSPFWRGADTGYHSYRSQMWMRWPTAGSAPALRSMAEYDELVSALLATGVMRDPAMLYWDIRASQRYDTVEYRVADVCLRVDDAVLVAALARALTRTGVRAEQAGEPCADVRPELLKAAHWRAARDGVSGSLVHPVSGRPAPASEVLARLVGHVRPALEADGAAAFVEHAVAGLLRRGSGATRQRAAFGRDGRIEDVIGLLADETEAPG